MSGVSESHPLSGAVPFPSPTPDHAPSSLQTTMMASSLTRFLSVSKDNVPTILTKWADLGRPFVAEKPVFFLLFADSYLTNCPVWAAGDDDHAVEVRLADELDAAWELWRGNISSGVNPPCLGDRGYRDLQHTVDLLQRKCPTHGGLPPDSNNRDLQHTVDLLQVLGVVVFVRGTGSITEAVDLLLPALRPRAENIVNDALLLVQDKSDDDNLSQKFLEPRTIIERAWKGVLHLAGLQHAADEDGWGGVDVAGGTGLLDHSSIDASAETSLEKSVLPVGDLLAEQISNRADLLKFLIVGGILRESGALRNSADEDVMEHCGRSSDGLFLGRYRVLARTTAFGQELATTTDHDESVEEWSATAGATPRTYAVVEPKTGKRYLLELLRRYARFFPTFFFQHRNCRNKGMICYGRGREDFATRRGYVAGIQSDQG